MNHGQYLLTAAHTNEVFMLIPVACTQQGKSIFYKVFVAIIELDQIEPAKDVHNYMRIN